MRRHAGAQERRRTFVDDLTQQRFEQEGFVVVDLIDDDARGSLLDTYEALGIEELDEWPFADGFHTSVYNNHPSYRAAVRGAFDTHIQPRLDQILDGYQIFWANYTVKLPKGGPVPLHADWTFLDEDRYSSATVWTALMDTNEDNGTLGVVSRSHERLDFVRVVNVPSNERCGSAVADITCRPVIPLRAGQAIIMDNRLAHFSPSNSTAVARIAAGSVVAPKEAALHHYWKNEEGVLYRFELERDFFLHYVVGQDPSEFDGVLSATAVDLERARDR